MSFQTARRTSAVTKATPNSGSLSGTPLYAMHEPLASSSWGAIFSLAGASMAHVAIESRETVAGILLFGDDR